MRYNPITDQERRIIREMWTPDYTVTDICNKIGRGTAAIQRTAHAMGLGNKTAKLKPEIWSMPGLTEALKENWFLGLSSNKIATLLSEQFGIQISRMAVIGKVHRSGYVRNPEISEINRRFGGDAGRKIQGHGMTRRNPSAGRVIPNPDAHGGKVREAWVIVTDAAWDILPGSEPKTLLNRRNFGECKYPVGVDEPEQRFCCIRTAQTYCDTHRAIMFRPPTKNERDLERRYRR